MSTRLPPQPREQLNPSQQEFRDHFHAAASKHGHPGAAERATNTLFPVLAVLPKTGRLSVNMLASLAEETEGYLPEDAREVASLVTTTFFRCAYATYAHKMIVVKLSLLTQDQVDLITSSHMPEDLNPECKLAYETAKYLLEVRGPLSQELWDRCVKAFQLEGAIGLMHYVSLLSWTSMGLNTVDVPAPPTATRSSSQ